MMSSQRVVVLVVASMAIACGELPDGGAPVSAATQALRPSDATAAFNLSSEEISVVELAKLAQHRVTDAEFLAYVQAQQARHQDLLNGLKDEAAVKGWAIANGMSQSGAQQWTALLQKSGVTFRQMYLRLQVPWQRQVINKLAQLQQNAEDDRLRAYANGARAAWEQEFKEAAALDPR